MDHEDILRIQLFAEAEYERRMVNIRTLFPDYADELVTQCRRIAMASPKSFYMVLDECMRISAMKGPEAFLGRSSV